MDSGSNIIEMQKKAPKVKKPSAWQPKVSTENIVKFIIATSN